jgi:peroxiredoxin
MAKNRQLNFNHSAPHLTLLNSSGESVQLSSLWTQRTLLLAFTRHFGCTHCKEKLDELVAGREQIEKARLGIAVIMQGTPKATAVFAQQFAPGLLCLYDHIADHPPLDLLLSGVLSTRWDKSFDGPVGSGVD